MSHPKTADIWGLLKRLEEAGVEFIVVGGAAAVAHGSGYNTRDLDIVHRRSPENVERLLALLENLDAFFRTDLSGRKLRPGASHLGSRGQVLLSTALGPLDLLCQLHDGRGYEELLPHSEIVEEAGLRLRLLDVATLIEVKTAAGRPKDQLAVMELLALQERRRKS